MLVRVDLGRILIREMTDTQFITLVESEGGRSFPIAIGLPEAFAIERRLRKVEVPRPQTHDLLSSLVVHLGGQLTRIVIHALQEGTFYANLVIQKDGEEILVDARPSDAIAFGVAEDVPIFVDEDVLTEACEEVADEAEPFGVDPGWSPDMVDDDEEDDEDDSWHS
ncbi:MAG: bifunctional nuclease family protein [Phycisphaerales bacterium]|nr:bifunctional nuclease family protein [Phycisphaerales bacterium]